MTKQCRGPGRWERTLGVGELLEAQPVGPASACPKRAVSPSSASLLQAPSVVTGTQPPPWPLALSPAPPHPAQLTRAHTPSLPRQPPPLLCAAALCLWPSWARSMEVGHLCSCSFILPQGCSAHRADGGPLPGTSRGAHSRPRGLPEPMDLEKDGDGLGKGCVEESP